MKTGLVLEGGAMRGMYTAGVLDIFMENNITVDGAIGVSAGATFGCNFKSKQIEMCIRDSHKSNVFTNLSDYNKQIPYHYFLNEKNPFFS